MRAHDDVARLDVAMKDAAGMGVVDGIAHVEEATEKLSQLERAKPGVSFQNRAGVELCNGLLEALAADEPHRVKRTAIGISAQGVDGHDSRVLEPPGDLRFQQEAGRDWSGRRRANRGSA